MICLGFEVEVQKMARDKEKGDPNTRSSQSSLIEPGQSTVQSVPSCTCLEVSSMLQGYQHLKTGMQYALPNLAALVGVGVPLLCNLCC